MSEAYDYERLRRCSIGVDRHGEARDTLDAETTLAATVMGRSEAKDLRCRVCGKTCPCLLYGEPVEHAHCPGGFDGYLLCDTHQEECLAVHRPVAADGTWRWINDCGDPNCGYCAALKEWKKEGRA